MKQLVSNTQIWVYLVIGGGKALSLIQIVVLASILSVIDFGIYGFWLSWFSVFLILMSMGEERLLNREVPALLKDHKKASFMQLMRVIFKIHLCKLPFLAVLLAIVFSFAESAFKERIPYLLIFFLIWFRAVFTIIRVAWYLMGRVLAAVCMEHLFFPLTFLLVAFSYLQLSEQPFLVEMAISMRVVICLLGILLLVFFLRKSVIGITERGKDHSAPIYSFGSVFSQLSWLSLIAGFRLVTLQTDSIMLGELMGPESVATYRIALLFGWVCELFLLGTHLYILPQISALIKAGKKAELQKLIIKYSRLCFFLCLPWILCFISFPEFFVTLFGQQYSDAAEVLRVLAFQDLIKCMTYLSLPVFLMHGKDFVNLILWLSIMLLNVLLNYLLIKVMGIQGAALATSISISLGFVISVYLVWRIQGIRTDVISQFLMNFTKLR